MQRGSSMYPRVNLCWKASLNSTKVTGCADTRSAAVSLARLSDWSDRFLSARRSMHSVMTGRRDRASGMTLPVPGRWRTSRLNRCSTRRHVCLPHLRPNHPPRPAAHHLPPCQRQHRHATPRYSLLVRVHRAPRRRELAHGMWPSTASASCCCSCRPLCRCC